MNIGLVITAFVVLLFGIILISPIAEIINSNEVKGIKIASNFNESLLTDSFVTLTHSPYASFTATAKNQTWLNFNGINQRVEIGSDVTNATGQLTITAWINHSNQSASAAPIVSQFNSGGWRFILTNGAVNPTTLRFGYRNNPGSYVEIASTGTVSNGIWHFVALTFDASTRNATFYINGTNVGSGLGTDTAYPSWNAFIGHDGNAGRWFNGSIDEVRIYNTTLTQNEIQEIYNAGR